MSTFLFSNSKPKAKGPLPKLTPHSSTSKYYGLFKSNSSHSPSNNEAKNGGMNNGEEVKRNGKEKMDFEVLGDYESDPEEEPEENVAEGVKDTPMVSQVGFQIIGDRFNEMGIRFNEIDYRFNDMGDHLEELEERSHEQHSRLNYLTDMVENLETRTKAIHYEHRALAEKCKEEFVWMNETLMSLAVHLGENPKLPPKF